MPHTSKFGYNSFCSSFNFIHSITGYIPDGDSSSSYSNVRISTQSPFKNTPATLLIPGQWYNANIDPLSFWRARLTVDQSSQNYEMNLTFVGSNSGIGIGEKVGFEYVLREIILVLKSILQLY